jgi:hypothetical protein
VFVCDTKPNQTNPSQHSSPHEIIRLSGRVLLAASGSCFLLADWGWKRQNRLLLYKVNPLYFFVMARTVGKIQKSFLLLKVYLVS